MQICSSYFVPPSYPMLDDNDPTANCHFSYRQATSALKSALTMFPKDFPIFRPVDYFAEMAKSDLHMEKVRRKILHIEKSKEKREEMRRLKEEKKFALKTQKATEDRKRKQKSKLMGAMKNHRKGMKAQLDLMLKNASLMHKDDDNRVS